MATIVHGWLVRHRYAANMRRFGHRSISWRHFRLSTWVATCGACGRRYGVHIGDYLSEHPHLGGMSTCPGRRR